jgi:hypothetical protein
MSIEVDETALEGEGYGPVSCSVRDESAPIPRPLAPNLLISGVGFWQHLSG